MCKQRSCLTVRQPVHPSTADGDRVTKQRCASDGTCSDQTAVQGPAGLFRTVVRNVTLQTDERLWSTAACTPSLPLRVTSSLSWRLPQPLAACHLLPEMWSECTKQYADGSVQPIAGTPQNSTA